MGGQRGQRPARLGHRLGSGAGGLGGAEQALVHHAGEHAVAGGAGVPSVTVGAAALGQLRQGDEQRRLRDRQPARLLAEIGERGGAHAFEVAAIGGERQVALEDVALRQPALDLQRPEGLAKFGAERAAGARLDEAGELHGEGGAARDDAAMGDELPGGAQRGQRVDAGVGLKALVLVGDQHVEEGRVHLVKLHGEAPAPVGGGEGAQQRAVAVEHFGRSGGSGERRRVGGIGGEEGADRRRRQPEGGGSGKEGAAKPDLHGALWPVRVRA